MLSLLPSLRVLKRGYDVDSSKANKSMTAIIQSHPGSSRQETLVGTSGSSPGALPAPPPLFHVTLCSCYGHEWKTGHRSITAQTGPRSCGQSDKQVYRTAVQKQVRRNTSKSPAATGTSANQSTLPFPGKRAAVLGTEVTYACYSTWLLTRLSQNM